MRDMEQLFYLRQLLGSGQGWLQVGFLLCLFAVLLFRPERIRSPALFRLALLLFVLSVIVPHVLTFCFAFLQYIHDDFSITFGKGSNWLLVTLQGASGPILLGLSLILAFEALSPGSPPQRRASPVKHPLE